MATTDFMIAKSGIYQIRNTENGKRYIGSAKCFRVRWAKHSRELLSGGHHSYKLQRAWECYLAEAFTFEILLVCAPHDCLYYEQRFLDTFCPEYNVSPTAGSRLGAKSTEEHRSRISAAHMGKTYGADRKAQISATSIARNAGKKYDLAGERLSIRDASKKFSVSYNVLQHRIKVCGSLQAAVEHTPADRAEITRLAHAANRSRAGKFIFSGECRSIPEWASFFSVSPRSLYKKIRRGMTVEQAIASFRRPRVIVFRGLTKTFSEWCIDTGLTESTLSGRIRRGWSIQDALTIPTGVQGMDGRKAHHELKHAVGHSL